jgi:hypothetical protein
MPKSGDCIQNVIIHYVHLATIPAHTSPKRQNRSISL